MGPIKDQQRLLLQSGLRGFGTQEAGGLAWQWTCMETMGESSVAPFRGHLRPLPNGHVMTTGVRGGRQARDEQLCSFPITVGLEEALIRDVLATGDQNYVIGTDTLDGITADRIYVSGDGGESFTNTGSAMPMGFSTASAQIHGTRWIAAGDCNRNLCSAYSDDLGVTWSLSDPWPVATRNLWTARVPPIPASAAIIPILLDAFEPEVQQLPSNDTLYISRDRGETLEAVFQPGLALHGVTVSPDGSKAAVSTDDGLYVGSLEVMAGENPSFAPVSSLPVRGVLWTEEGLYVGLDEILAGVNFSVGLSKDGGQTFAAVMSLCDLAAPTCAADSAAGVLCPAVYSDNGESGGGFKEDFADSAHCKAMRNAGPKSTADGGVSANAENPEDQASVESNSNEPANPAEMAGGAGQAGSTPATPQSSSAMDPASEAHGTAATTGAKQAMGARPSMDDAAEDTVYKASGGGCGCSVAGSREPLPALAFFGLLSLRLVKLSRRRKRR